MRETERERDEEKGERISEMRGSRRWRRRTENDLIKSILNEAAVALPARESRIKLGSARV